MKIPLFLRPLLLRLVAAACAAAAGVAGAQTADDVVLMSNSSGKVTRAEYNAELLKLPRDLRDGFANSPRRVNDLLVRMLVQKSLAAQARTAKLDATPEARLRIAARARSAARAVDGRERRGGRVRRVRREPRALRGAREGALHDRPRTLFQPGPGERDARAVRRQEAGRRRGEAAGAGGAREDPGGRGHGQARLRGVRRPVGQAQLRRARLVREEGDGPGVRRRGVRAQESGRRLASPCSRSSAGT